VVAALSTGEVDLLIVDSLTELTPRAELEKPSEDRMAIASRAQLLKKLMHRLLALRTADGLDSLYKPTVVFTSQVSTHMAQAVSWLAPANGNAVDHGIAVDVKLEVSGYKMLTEKVCAAMDVKFEIKKQKTDFGVGSTGDITFQLIETPEAGVGDSKDEEEVLKYALDFKLVEEGTKTSEKYVFVADYGSGVPPERLAFSTKKALIAFMRDNRTVYMELRRKVINTILAAERKLLTKSELVSNIVADSAAKAQAKADKAANSKAVGTAAAQAAMAVVDNLSLSDVDELLLAGGEDGDTVGGEVVDTVEDDDDFLD
jgi:hypothetical protein